MADSEVWALEIRDVLKAPGVPDGIHFTVLERFGDMASAIKAVPVEFDDWREVREMGHFGKYVGKSAAVMGITDTGYRVYVLNPEAELGPERRRTKRTVVPQEQRVRRWTRIVRGRVI